MLAVLSGHMGLAHSFGYGELVYHCVKSITKSVVNV